MDFREKNFLGKYLKDQRELRGKTIREMSSELGVMPIVISDVEKGNKLPSIELLQDMKKTYGIENDFCIEFLLNRQEKQISKNPPAKEVPKVVVCPARKDDNPFRSR